MEYCIVEDGVIVNMIVAEADFAEEIGALPSYEGAAIGGAYTPPPPEPEPRRSGWRSWKRKTAS